MSDREIQFETFYSDEMTKRKSIFAHFFQWQNQNNVTTWLWDKSMQEEVYGALFYYLINHLNYLVWLLLPSISSENGMLQWVHFRFSRQSDLFSSSVQQQKI